MLEISSPTRTTSRKKAKAKTRQAILNAAERLFSRQGYEETRAEDIAKQANVAVGTIYLHFGDKEGLLREILLISAEELHERVLAVYQDPPDSPLALARAHVETLITYIEEHNRLSSFVLALMLSGHSAATPMLELSIEQVESNIRDGQVRGIYRQDINAALAARAEAQMNLGLLAWWAQDPRRAGREEIIDTLAKIRFSGLHQSH